MTRFKIDEASPLPVYQQVKQFIIIDILSGRLKEGDKLPPIRGLAKILRLNPNTVAKVYYNLEDEGFIQGKRGSGYLVKSQKQKLDKIKVSIIEDELKELLKKAFSIGFSKEDIENLMRRLLNNE
ncbi:MAG: GntR family transcriptional regulator [Candidatus Aminicenantes bacterium]|nr:GntR family transcriptional regulator [Candidatus Aminicenantes bacterium]